ncbi:hypothetical protein U8527_09930 [Kordia algicida OT-1]|uniref:Uncharacterized protein n=1 Tax=Kordia algicida OT-1 TaxID=391587 RepID=A9DVH2_9FLAO|nr:hypothetical protein [Kordia algicida]EDP96421.1 hypothetical protein KAOT1_03392 [Kordia algicida OT-1]
MASSFIEHKNYGFWASDGFVEAMQICLIDEIEATSFDSKSWIIQYKDELALQSIPLVYGGMSMSLDRFLINDERKKIVIDLIDKIIQKINSDETYLNNENLRRMRKNAMLILYKQGNTFQDESEIDEDVKNSRWRGNDSDGNQFKDRCINAFQLLKKLINEELKTDAGSPESYWDFKK